MYLEAFKQPYKAGDFGLLSWHGLLTLSHRLEFEADIASFVFVAEVWNISRYGGKGTVT